MIADWRVGDRLTDADVAGVVGIPVMVTLGREGGCEIRWEGWRTVRAEPDGSWVVVA